MCGKVRFFKKPDSMFQNIIKIPSLMLLVGMSFFLTGARSGDETVEADISYELVLKNAVLQMEGDAEGVDLTRVSENEYEDEFVDFNLDPAQYNTFLFEVSVMAKVMGKPYELNPMSVRYWDGEAKEDVSISREDGSTFDAAAPRVFKFFPEKQLAPFSYKGPKREAKAVMDRAEKFKGTKLVLIVPVSLEDQVYKYQFVFEVRKVVIDVR